MKTFFLLFLTTLSLSALECYQRYDYKDTHQVQTRIEDKVVDENQTVDAHLHVRHIENNATHYTIFWLEMGITDKDKIDIETVYAPFMVKHTLYGFEIEKLYSLSKDTKLKKQLLSLVDSMQFAPMEGKYRFKNGTGAVEVNQSKTDNGHRVTWLKQIAQDDVVLINNYNDIVLDSNCSVWHSVTSHHKNKIMGFIPSIYMIDNRTLSIAKSSASLPKEHWFMSLGVDLTKWKISKIKKMSLKDALSQFDAKHKEMMALLDDKEQFVEWMRDNMEFLSYLDEILTSRQLNNEVSMNIFANLGYFDSVEGSRILAKVTLNESIDENERFRALMGLKNTSAPLDDETLETLLEYGLNPDNGEDWLKNATGMLMGALAKERTNRSPEQTKRINEAIEYGITTFEDKRVIMAAAGNMGEGATKEVVKAIGDVVTTTNDYKSRRESAQAIEKLNRTDLNSDTFAKLIAKEENSDTKAQLIKATAATKDLPSNQKLKNEFLNIANTHEVIESNRMASLIALEKSGYGKTKNEKATLRTMMLGEKNSKISEQLKKMYRK